MLKSIHLFIILKWDILSKDNFYFRLKIQQKCLNSTFLAEKKSALCKVTMTFDLWPLTTKFRWVHPWGLTDVFASFGEIFSRNFWNISQRTKKKKRKNLKITFFSYLFFLISIYFFLFLYFFVPFRRHCAGGSDLDWRLQNIKLSATVKCLALSDLLETWMRTSRQRFSFVSFWLNAS